MHRPSSTALAARARTLLEHMHAAGHWVYAVPSEEAERYLVGRTTGLTVTRRDDLDVTLLEAHRAEAAAELAEALGHTGFFAQSALLDSAYDVSTDDARTALSTLAHMAVQWDDVWAELFELHFEDAAADVRKSAVAALLVAANTSRGDGLAHCTALLARVRARELARASPDVLSVIEEGLTVLALATARRDR